MHHSPVRIQWDWSRIAHRFRERRRLFGWTIDEVAERTGVSRDTVMRVEKAKACSIRTLHSLRSAYRFFSAQLTSHESESKYFSSCRADQVQWMAANNHDHKGRPVKDIEYSFVNDPQERSRRAALGHQKFFSGFIRSELEDGVLSSGLMEIHQASPFDQHFGEEFIYCLSGTALMTVESDTCVLNPGDSMVFDALRRHRYAPAPESDGPATILFVVGVRPDEARRVAESSSQRKSWGV